MSRLVESVRQVVASSTGSRVVVAAFEHDVEVWDLDTRRLVGAFATGVDYGGRRLALSDSADVLIAGAYRRSALTAHATDTGEIRWMRPELRKVQTLSLSADGERLFCGRQGFPCEVLSVSTGVTLDRIRGTSWIVESPWETVCFFDQHRPVVVNTVTGKKVYIALQSSAILDAVFAPERLVISEMGGSVRCVSLTDGGELWCYTPDEGRHVLDLTYRPNDDVIVGVEWSYARADESTMRSWDASTGASMSRIDLDPRVPHVYAFCQRGESIVTPARQVLSTVDGELRFRLDHEEGDDR